MFVMKFHQNPKIGWIRPLTVSVSHSDTNRLKEMIPRKDHGAGENENNNKIGQPFLLPIEFANHTDLLK